MSMTTGTDPTYSSDMTMTTNSESETSHLKEGTRKKKLRSPKNKVQRKKLQPLEKPFACNYCRKQTSTEKGLKIHLSRKHHHKTLPYCCGSSKPQTLEKTFACNYCRKRTSTEKGLKIHLSIKHHHKTLPYSCGSSIPQTLEKNFACNDCNKRSSTKIGITTHVSKIHCHKTLPYSCGSCKRTFHAYCHSQSHKCIPLYSIMGLHTCRFCELQFREQVNLNHHVKIVHCRESLQVCTCDDVNVMDDIPLCSLHPQAPLPVSRQEEKESRGTMSNFNLQLDLDSDSEDVHSESDDLDSDPGDLDLYSVSDKLQVQDKVKAPPKPVSCTSYCYGNMQATSKPGDHPNVTVEDRQCPLQVEREHNYGNQQATPMPDNKPDWPMQGLKQLLQVYREHNYAGENEDGQRLSTSRVEDTPDSFSEIMTASKPPDILSKQPVGTARDLNGRYIWVYATAPG